MRKSRHLKLQITRNREYFVVSGIGLVAFLLLAFNVPTQSNLFESLFSKPQVLGASPLYFVDASSKPLQETKSASVRVVLNSPWPAPDASVYLLTTSKNPKPESEKMTKSAILSEDSGFTKNVKAFSPYISNPTTIQYEFSSKDSGTKVLFVKYISYTGEEKKFQTTITIR